MAKYTKKQINEIADVLHHRYIVYEKDTEQDVMRSLTISKKSLAVLDVASDLSYYFSKLDSTFDHKKFLDEVINGRHYETKGFIVRRTD